MQRHRAADGRIEDLAHGIDAISDIDDLRVEALPPCECQQLAGQGRATLRRRSIADSARWLLGSSLITFLSV